LAHSTEVILGAKIGLMGGVTVNDAFSDNKPTEAVVAETRQRSRFWPHNATFFDRKSQPKSPDG
jgi:hypothetical protein